MRRQPGPTVTPFKVTPTSNEDVDVVHVHCPFCGKDHRHAWTDDGDDALPRWNPSHCRHVYQLRHWYWITLPREDQ
jgi:transposase-like protein